MVLVITFRRPRWLMRHDALGDAELGAGCEDAIEERNQNGEAFEREALGAEIARLDDLLEDVGADKLGEDVLLVGSGRRLLHALLQPLALLRAGNVHELGGDGAAVDSCGPPRQLRLRVRGWERVQAEGTGRADRARPAGIPSGERCRKLLHGLAVLLREPVGSATPALVAIASSLQVYSRKAKFAILLLC